MPYPIDHSPNILEVSVTGAEISMTDTPERQGQRCRYNVAENFELGDERGDYTKLDAATTFARY